MYFKSKYSRRKHPNVSFLAYMSYITNNDNIYKIGTTISAKAKPDVKLIIMRYYHRTYYCADVNDMGREHGEYFEKQLIPPAKSTIQQKILKPQ